MSTKKGGTDSLVAHLQGDPAAIDELLPLVYSSLRRLAAKRMRAERAGHTLEPTAVVHEAYARLVDATRIDWQGKTHFFALAAREMRRVLRESARKRSADKRGGGAVHVTLNEDAGVLDENMVEFLTVDEALKKLAQHNERRAKVVEYRVFAGMGDKEIGAVLGIAERTVREDWRMAKAWLSRELRPGK